MKRVQVVTKYVPSKCTKLVIFNLFIGMIINLVVFFNLQLRKALLEQPAGQSNNQTIQKSEKKKAVLLMAGYRGGSTLTGELFNRNSRALYYFGKVSTREKK